MKGLKIPIYQGEINSCIQCGRKFENGEMISVVGEEELFCYTTAEGGCITVYVFATGRPMAGKPMIFRNKEVKMKIGAKLVKIRRKHYIVFEQGKIPETPPFSESKVKVLIEREGNSEEELINEAREEIEDYARRQYGIRRVFIL